MKNSLSANLRESVKSADEVLPHPQIARIFAEKNFSWGFSLPEICVNL